MKKIFSLIFAAALFLPFMTHAAVTPRLNTLAPHQGDTLIITLPAKTAVKTATFAGQNLSFFPYRGTMRALAGIPPAQSPGTYRLRISLKNGTATSRLVTIKKKTFPLVDLGVPDSINETPDQVVQGFGDINAVLNKIVIQKTAAAFTTGFAMPIQDFTGYGSPFGELRKTGDNLVRHLGTDFTAPVGTPVFAIQNGTVRFATSTELYGNTIVIDHGAGVYSLYLHLSRMDVNVGDKVAKGQTLGGVGQTGYAFGPHLHFSLKVNGVSVDPVLFIKGF